SGRCNIRFDVSPEGQPFNIVAVYCSHSVFKRPTIKSVQKWKYQPKIVNGLPVSRSGVETSIKFRILDDRGREIPE
ncbi:MAG: energy transducer TonB, partial [Robiginitomaculum sp.]|nr:energy transducer TonB [Robiginitomaculum sp.]